MQKLKKWNGTSKNSFQLMPPEASAVNKLLCLQNYEVGSDDP